MYDDNHSPDRVEAAVETDNWVPQFGLRALLGLVALMAVLFAVARTFGYRWGIVLGWFVLLGAVHVAANAWGARRRRAELLSADACSGGPQRHAAPVHGSRRVCGAVPMRRTVQVHGATPTISRVDATAGGESIMRRDNRQGSLAGGVAVVVAMVAGALAAALLAVLYGDRCGVGGVILGGVSAGVIGGLAAFAATAFFECATRAWSEAISADSPRGEDNA